jgi:hypothetical protein
LFENFSENRLKEDQSNDTKFNPPLFSLVNTFNLVRGRFESLEDIELRDRREKTEQREKDKKEKLRAERLKRMQAFQVQLFVEEDQKIFCFVSGEKYRNLCGEVFSRFCGSQHHFADSHPSSEMAFLNSLLSRGFWA